MRPSLFTVSFLSLLFFFLNLFYISSYHILFEAPEVRYTLVFFKIA